MTGLERGIKVVICTFEFFHCICIHNFDLFLHPPPKKIKILREPFQFQIVCRSTWIKGPASTGVSFEVESMEVDPAPVSSPVKRNRTTSSANYESSPAQILSSLQNVLSVTIPGSESSSKGSISCPQASSLAGMLEPSDLIGPLLAEAVSQQSLAGATKYLMMCYNRLRDEYSVTGARSQALTD